MADECYAGRVKIKIFSLAWALAQEAKKARGNHAAIFVSLMQKQLGYPVKQKGE